VTVIGLATSGWVVGADAHSAQDPVADFPTKVGDAAAARWIRDDWEQAKATAAKSTKPIFAVFRCVP
jgi:hypothetical protein